MKINGAARAHINKLKRRLLPCFSGQIRAVNYILEEAMTGEELIHWIRENNAEDKIVAVSCKDEYGDTACHISPVVVNANDHFFDCEPEMRDKDVIFLGW